MEKQAKSEFELTAMQTGLQIQFSNFDQSQRERIANYLNMYNSTAWMYNVILSDDERKYVDQSMQYVLETQRLEAKMNGAQSPADVEQVIDRLNDMLENGK